MKYVFIVLDGAADEPIRALGGKTPLEVADIPNINSLARSGVLGRVKTVPEGFIPSSDVANLALLGYDPEQYYSGRGPLESANLGVALYEGDVAFRCNFITESDGTLMDYSAGHINNQEAGVLIRYLDQKLGNSQMKFYSGKSYRNLMVYKGGGALGFDKLRCYPPHDILGKKIESHLPYGENSQIIVELIKESKQLLKGHEINKVRIDLRENPANMIWLWGAGLRPNMEMFQKKFGLTGAVISAVDLINGIGKLIGLHVIHVDGATGYYDTNYKGKGEAALKSLQEVDFVFVHIEAPDEAGHNQDLRMKINCIEKIDRFVVGTILKGLKGNEFRVLISPDHPTPVEKRTHTDEPVPFLLYGNGIAKGNFRGYSEAEAQNSSLYFAKGSALMNYFLGK